VRLLSLETTCDETGAAVLEAPGPGPGGVPRVLSSVVASQFELHARFGGVVPEIAARAHLERILPVIDEALRRAGLNLADLEAVAVATRPGLVGSLLVGLAAAKGLSLALGVPLVGFDHLEGHLDACRIAHPDREVYPCVGLVVSGGHTHLYRCAGPLDFVLLGGTLDDAAGEAFDKVASLLGLGFPGGPAVERTAKAGNPRAFAFPRAFVHDERLAFSFSGLKTAVLYAVRDLRGGDAQRALGPREQADLAASFQAAVVDALVAKALQACRATGLRRLCLGGGVVANALLRDRMAAACAAAGLELVHPPMSLCTDNAALGGVAFERLARGESDGLEVDVEAGLRR
jgi:N6-L-threonylcarbamoyladenine synthase